MSNGWVTVGIVRIAIVIKEKHLRISVDIV